MKHTEPTDDKGFLIGRLIFWLFFMILILWCLNYETNLYKRIESEKKDTVTTNINDRLSNTTKYP